MADRQFFSFWLNRRDPPKPDTRKTRLERRATVMALFERMLASDDERFRGHLYILAHTLMKCRMLKWEGSETDENGVEQILFRNPTTDEIVRVPEIDLSDEDWVATKREIDTSIAVSAELDAVDEEESDVEPSAPE
jgi:hypothetical protein